MAEKIEKDRRRAWNSPAGIICKMEDPSGMIQYKYISLHVAELLDDISRALAAGLEVKIMCAGSWVELSAWALSNYKDVEACGDNICNTMVNWARCWLTGED